MRSRTTGPRRRRPLPRPVCRDALLAVVVALPLVLGPVTAAAAAGLRGSGTIATPIVAPANPEAEATLLAVTIELEATRIDQLSERLDGSALRAQLLAAQLGDTETKASAIQRRVDVARRLVRRQAVALYMGTDRVGMSTLDGPGAADFLMRREGYAGAIVSSQTDDLGRLEMLGDQLAGTEARLTVERADNQAVAARVARDRRAAAAAVAARRLTQQAAARRGLTALVQARQGQLAAAEAARIEAGFGVGPSGPRAAATRSRVHPSRAAAVRPPQPRRRAPPPRETSPPTSIPAPASRHPVEPPPVPPGPPVPAGDAPARGWQTAVAYARAQLGKPYLWGGAGPGSFDCSGLVMRAWDAAGVDLPHLAQDQYDLTIRIPIAELQPGDLVFYGTPSNVYHVGIYVGGGRMIDAPTTGETVHYTSIYFYGLLSGGRVT